MNATEVGPTFLWRFAAEEGAGGGDGLNASSTLRELANGRSGNSHDVQWAAPGGADAFWQPGATGASLRLVDAASGAVLRSSAVAQPSLDDEPQIFNHVTVVENDTVAYLSNRGTNSFTKVCETRDQLSLSLSYDY